jgi:glutathione S-transferase
MKLYYAPGACSLAPHIALREADRAFELERVDLKTRRTSGGADYLTINPKGYVPALELAPGEVLTEASVILQYIADLAPDHHLAPPTGTLARYRLQEWLNFISSELHKQFGPLLAPDTPAATAARARAKVAERMLYVSDVLYDRAFLMGETFTVADCYMVPMLRWCERFGIDIQVWPNIDAYHLKLVDRPSVVAALTAEGLLETRRRHIA